MEPISENNPDLDEMRERGWAWIQRSTITGKHGAPYTDDWYATAMVRSNHPEESEDEENIDTSELSIRQELLIVWWD